MSEWRNDLEALNDRSADPGNMDFKGFIDMKDQHGNTYHSVYQTPMGHWVSREGQLPQESYIVQWREAV